MKNILHKKVPESIELLLLVILITFSFGVFVKYWSEEIKQKDEYLGQKISHIEGQLETYQKYIESLQNDNKNLTSAFIEEQNNRLSINTNLQRIAGTVQILEKLQSTDPQLLQKYSKVYFLNENYIPANLTLINPIYVQGEKLLQIHGNVWPHLENLMIASNQAGLSLRVISSYRSFGTQSALKTAYTIKYGSGTANQFSAEQGYSEHQLGTTVDFTTKENGDSFSKFKDSPEYQWLLSNAHLYGFVLSYPEGNKYYIFEPWHFRFVGKALATRLYNEKKHFYEMDQRTINEYIANIFD
jgi:LAS superfamily LD-carboxypeptidase LdcB